METAGRRRLNPEERRAQLLECAVAVFARRGLGEAHHAEIAADAGVSVSTVFVYFPTRDALVDAVLDQVEAISLAAAKQCYSDPSLPAVDASRMHLMATAEALATFEHHARVWIDWSTSIGQRYWPRFVAHQEELVLLAAETLARGQREGTIRRDLGAEDLARLAVGSGQMIAQLACTNGDRAALDRFIDTLMAIAAPPSA